MNRKGYFYILLQYFKKFFTIKISNSSGFFYEKGVRRLNQLGIHSTQSYYTGTLKDKQVIDKNIDESEKVLNKQVGDKNIDESKKVLKNENLFRDVNSLASVESKKASIYTDDYIFWEKDTNNFPLYTFKRYDIWFYIILSIYVSLEVFIVFFLFIYIFGSFSDFITFSLRNLFIFSGFSESSGFYSTGTSLYGMVLVFLIGWFIIELIFFFYDQEESGSEDTIIYGGDSTISPPYKSIVISFLYSLYAIPCFYICFYVFFSSYFVFFTLFFVFSYPLFFVPCFFMLSYFKKLINIFDYNETVASHISRRTRRDLESSSNITAEKELGDIEHRPDVFYKREPKQTMQEVFRFLFHREKFKPSSYKDWINFDPGIDQSVFMKKRRDFLPNKFSNGLYRQLRNLPMEISSQNLFFLEDMDIEDFDQSLKFLNYMETRDKQLFPRIKKRPVFNPLLQRKYNLLKKYRSYFVDSEDTSYISRIKRRYLKDRMAISLRKNSFNDYIHFNQLRSMRISSLIKKLYGYPIRSFVNSPSVALNLGDNPHLGMHTPTGPLSTLPFLIPGFNQSIGGSDVINTKPIDDRTFGSRYLFSTPTIPPYHDRLRAFYDRENEFLYKNLKVHFKNNSLAGFNEFLKKLEFTFIDKMIKDGRFSRKVSHDSIPPNTNYWSAYSHTGESLFYHLDQASFLDPEDFGNDRMEVLDKLSFRKRPSYFIDLFDFNYTKALFYKNRPLEILSRIIYESSLKNALKPSTNRAFFDQYNGMRKSVLMPDKYNRSFRGNFPFSNYTSFDDIGFLSRSLRAVDPYDFFPQFYFFNTFKNKNTKRGLRRLLNKNYGSAWRNDNAILKGLLDKKSLFSSLYNKKVLSSVQRLKDHFLISDEVLKSRFRHLNNDISRLIFFNEILKYDSGTNLTLLDPALDEYIYSRPGGPVKRNLEIQRKNYFRYRKRELLNILDTPYLQQSFPLESSSSIEGVDKNFLLGERDVLLFQLLRSLDLKFLDNVVFNPGLDFDKIGNFKTLNLLPLYYFKVGDEYDKALPIINSWKKYRSLLLLEKKFIERQSNFKFYSKKSPRGGTRFFNYIKGDVTGQNDLLTREIFLRQQGFYHHKKFSQKAVSNLSILPYYHSYLTLYPQRKGIDNRFLFNDLRRFLVDSKFFLVKKNFYGLLKRSWFLKRNYLGNDRTELEAGFRPLRIHVTKRKKRLKEVFQKFLLWKKWRRLQSLKTNLNPMSSERKFFKTFNAGSSDETFFQENKQLEYSMGVNDNINRRARRGSFYSKGDFKRLSRKAIFDLLINTSMDSLEGFSYKRLEDPSFLYSNLRKFDTVKNKNWLKDITLDKKFFYRQLGFNMIPFLNDNKSRRKKIQTTKDFPHHVSVLESIKKANILLNNVNFVIKGWLQEFEKFDLLVTDKIRDGVDPLKQELYDYFYGELIDILDDIGEDDEYFDWMPDGPRAGVGMIRRMLWIYLADKLTLDDILKDGIKLRFPSGLIREYDYVRKEKVESKVQVFESNGLTNVKMKEILKNTLFFDILLDRVLNLIVNCPYENLNENLALSDLKRSTVELDLFSKNFLAMLEKFNFSEALDLGGVNLKTLKKFTIDLDGCLEKFKDLTIILSESEFFLQLGVDTSLDGLKKSTVELDLFMNNLLKITSKFYFFPRQNVDSSKKQQTNKEGISVGSNEIRKELYILEKTMNRSNRNLTMLFKNTYNMLFDQLSLYDYKFWLQDCLGGLRNDMSMIEKSYSNLKNLIYKLYLNREFYGQKGKTDIYNSIRNAHLTDIFIKEDSMYNLQKEFPYDYLYQPLVNDLKMFNDFFESLSLFADNSTSRRKLIKRHRRELKKNINQSPFFKFRTGNGYTLRAKNLMNVLKARRRLVDFGLRNDVYENINNPYKYFWLKKNIGMDVSAQNKFFGHNFLFGDLIGKLNNSQSGPFFMRTKKGVDEDISFYEQLNISNIFKNNTPEFEMDKVLEFANQINFVYGISNSNNNADVKKKLGRSLGFKQKPLFLYPGRQVDDLVINSFFNDNRNYYTQHRLKNRFMVYSKGNYLGFNFQKKYPISFNASALKKNFFYRLPEILPKAMLLNSITLSKNQQLHLGNLYDLLLKKYYGFVALNKTRYDKKIYRLKKLKNLILFLKLKKISNQRNSLSEYSFDKIFRIKMPFFRFFFWKIRSQQEESFFIKMLRSSRFSHYNRDFSKIYFPSILMQEKYKRQRPIFPFGKNRRFWKNWDKIFDVEFFIRKGPESVIAVPFRNIIKKIPFDSRFFFSKKTKNFHNDYVNSRSYLDNSRFDYLKMMSDWGMVRKSGDMSYISSFYRTYSEALLKFKNFLQYYDVVLKNSSSIGDEKELLKKYFLYRNYRNFVFIDRFKVMPKSIIVLGSPMYEYLLDTNKTFIYGPFFKELTRTFLGKYEFPQHHLKEFWNYYFDLTTEAMPYKDFTDKLSSQPLDGFSGLRRQWSIYNSTLYKYFKTKYNVNTIDKVLFKIKFFKFLKYQKYNSLLNDLLESVLLSKPLVKKPTLSFFFNWDAPSDFLHSLSIGRLKLLREEEAKLRVLSPFFGTKNLDFILRNIDNVLINSSKSYHKVEIWPRFVSKNLRDKFYDWNLHENKFDPLIYNKQYRNLSFRNLRKEDVPSEYAILSNLRQLREKRYVDSNLMKKIYTKNNSFFNKLLSSDLFSSKSINLFDQKNPNLLLNYRRQKYLRSRQNAVFYNFFMKEYARNFLWLTDKFGKNSLYLQKRVRNAPLFNIEGKFYDTITQKKLKLLFWKNLKKHSHLNSENGFMSWIRRRYGDSFTSSYPRNSFLWKSNVFSNPKEIIPLVKSTFRQQLYDNILSRTVSVDAEAVYAKGQIKVPSVRLRDDFFIKRDKILTSLRKAVFAFKASSGFLYYNYKIRGWNDRINFHTFVGEGSVLDTKLEENIISRTVDFYVPFFQMHSILNNTSFLKLLDLSKMDLSLGFSESLDLFMRLHTILNRFDKLLFGLHHNIESKGPFFYSLNDEMLTGFENTPYNVFFNTEMQMKESFLRNGISSNLMFSSDISNYRLIDEFLLAEQIRKVSQQEILLNVHRYTKLVLDRESSRFFEIKKHFYLNRDIFEFYKEFYNASRKGLNILEPFFVKNHSKVPLDLLYLRKIEFFSTMEHFYNNNVGLFNFSSAHSLSFSNFFLKFLNIEREFIHFRALLYDNGFLFLENYISNDFFRILDSFFNRMDFVFQFLYKFKVYDLFEKSFNYVFEPIYLSSSFFPFIFQIGIVYFFFFWYAFVLLFYFFWFHNASQTTEAFVDTGDGFFSTEYSILNREDDPVAEGADSAALIPLNINDPIFNASSSIANDLLLSDTTSVLSKYFSEFFYYKTSIFKPSLKFLKVTEFFHENIQHSIFWSQNNISTFLRRKYKRSKARFYRTTPTSSFYPQRWYFIQYSWYLRRYSFVSKLWSMNNQLTDKMSFLDKNFHRYLFLDFYNNSNIFESKEIFKTKLRESVLDFSLNHLNSVFFQPIGRKKGPLVLYNFAPDQLLNRSNLYFFFYTMDGKPEHRMEFYDDPFKFYYFGSPFDYGFFKGNPYEKNYNCLLFPNKRSKKGKRRVQTSLDYSRIFKHFVKILKRKRRGKKRTNIFFSKGRLFRKRFIDQRIRFIIYKKIEMYRRFYANQYGIPRRLKNFNKFVSRKTIARLKKQIDFKRRAALNKVVLNPVKKKKKRFRVLKNRVLKNRVLKKRLRSRKVRIVGLLKRRNRVRYVDVKHIIDFITRSKKNKKFKNKKFKIRKFKDKKFKNKKFKNKKFFRDANWYKNKDIIKGRLRDFNRKRKLFGTRYRVGRFDYNERDFYESFIPKNYEYLRENFFELRIEYFFFQATFFFFRMIIVSCGFFVFFVFLFYIFSLIKLLV